MCDVVSALTMTRRATISSHMESRIAKGFAPAVPVVLPKWFSHGRPLRFKVRVNVEILPFVRLRERNFA
jgi:hypothetical protein